MKDGCEGWIQYHRLVPLFDGFLGPQRQSVLYSDVPCWHRENSEIWARYCLLKMILAKFSLGFYQLSWHWFFVQPFFGSCWKHRLDPGPKWIPWELDQEIYCTKNRGLNRGKRLEDMLILGIHALHAPLSKKTCHRIDTKIQIVGRVICRPWCWPQD